jgi:hypothetical protein
VDRLREVVASSANPRLVGKACSNRLLLKVRIIPSVEVEVVHCLELHLLVVPYSAPKTACSGILRKTSSRNPKPKEKVKTVAMVTMMTCTAMRKTKRLP